MTSDRINTLLHRRFIGPDGGWFLFCRLCGEYKPETEFYNSKSGKFGKTYKCKIHYQKSNEPVDADYNYLNLNKITDNDFIETENLLKRLGYKVGPNELPIWRQFEIKHNLNN